MNWAGINWTHQVDAYCERTDFSYWAEPVNAATNAAFVVVAILMWRRSEGCGPARALCVILGIIGIGSFLFHTHATQWAGMADVVPIGMFILFYLFLVHRDFIGMPTYGAILATCGFFPFAAVMMPVLGHIPFVEISNFYWTVPILLTLYAVGLRRKMPRTAKGMMGGAALLCLSITLRSLDESLCTLWPIGTHFAWHILNACMLGWMIEVYRRQSSIT